LTLEERKLDEEGGAMKIVVSDLENQSSSTLYAKISGDDCKTINTINQPVLGLSEFTLRFPEKFPIVIDTSKNNGTSSLPEIIPGKSTVYIKNNFWAWILKFGVIFGIWGLFILFIEKLFDFCKKFNSEA